MNINGINRNSTYLKKVEKVSKSKKIRNEEEERGKEERKKQHKNFIEDLEEEKGGNLDLTL